MASRSRLAIRGLAVLAVVAGVAGIDSAAACGRTIVFAAASFAEVLSSTVDSYNAATGCAIVVSTAATSVLARQVEAGAPADIFISADRRWMDYLEGRGLIDPASRRDLAANHLVVVGRTQATGGDPAILLAAGRFAMGEPENVPAGRYAKAALLSLGLWESLRDRAVFAGNVRIALQMAARGDVQTAIVYQSDATVWDTVHILYTFPEHTHPPIRYPAATTARAGPEARAFLRYLRENSGAALRKFGFVPIVAATRDG